MDKANTVQNSDVLKAFEAYEEQARLGNTRLGCILVVTLMPAGSVLDYFVYPAEFWPFFQLRLWCSALAAVILGALRTKWGQRASRMLGMLIAMLPVLFIAWMIAQTEGFESPYYAGLNLVLLAIGAVLRWTYVESVLGAVLVLLIYIIAGVFSTPDIKSGTVVNNFYFIILMDVIAVVGNYFQSKQRLSEFALRFELDKSRQMLQENHEKLIQLDEVKSRFFANISHELRTPLTLLVAPLESLLHQRDRLSREETQELLSTMHANSMRLLKLINDLLDLVRLESGKMEVKRESFDVRDFTKGLANAVRKMAEDKHLKVLTTVAENVEPVFADRDKLEKVLLNLLFNAIKFTPAGGRIEIIAHQEASVLLLEVKDTGMGIEKTQLGYIFERFWQADTSSKRKYQGVGIGLSLVKELVEIQGGTVTVESELGKGTTFLIRLPYLKAETAELAPAPATAPTIPVGTTAALATTTATESAGANGSTQEWLSGLYRRAELFPSLTSLHDALRPVEGVGDNRRPRILIADDEPDMLRFLKSQLSTYFQVLEAVDGQQAIEKAAQFLPDTILCDMMMPEKDGLQVCRELRAKTSTQNIPILLLTARADEETKLKALDAGASDFLTKPFSTTELHVRLKNLVSTSLSQRKLARQNQILESTLEQLKETEAQLVHNEKMASLGRMSAGIIHEINNPLNFTKTGLYTLRNKGKYLAPEQKPEYEEILKDIEDGVNRVISIVSDLRTFTHPRVGQFDQVEVHQLVTSALRFLSGEFKDKVSIEVLVSEEDVVRANRNQVIQVLVNLVQNAIDAFKKKQFLNDKPAIVIEGRHVGEAYHLTVRDNGEGISAENMSKIFDPFFTTKDVGQGMGLGLSICYRLMEEHGGRIMVNSELGKYCEFTLEFPLKVQSLTPSQN